MAKKGKPLEAIDIDAFLGNARNRVQRVGVELEGGWTKLPSKVQVVRDGSVVLDSDMVSAFRLQHVGELASPPLEVSEFPAFMTVNYPTVSNHTCGMHVHLSFVSPFVYQRLMVPTYPGTVVEYMRRWAEREKLPKGGGLELAHPLWERLAGKSKYCQHIFFADEQSRNRGKDYDQHRDGHRYTVINFCWTRYQTVECRLLPMMQSSKQGVSAVQEVINITNAFLRATAKRDGKLAREEKIKVTHVVDEAVSERERRIVV